ncbi:hypothetical protein FOZ62_010438 [Perkinsus olseni]|uniref:Uncharacterized protein n=1 Tax=Perkinsus olseni TaxID=32597 RepID=A0A7J6S6W5_PEROL|nr:hypothetical protein FOZ62_010438 [Perkinsus olseni]
MSIWIVQTAVGETRKDWNCSPLLKDYYGFLKRTAACQELSLTNWKKIDLRSYRVMMLTRGSHFCRVR